MNTTAVFHEKKTIAVVGGGLAALVLVRQLRNQLIASTDPVEILVIDPAPLDQFGRGRAYAIPWQPDQPQRVGSHAELLNSPAGRMSLVDVIGPEGDFVRWLQQHNQIWFQRLGLVSRDGKLCQDASENCQPWEQQAIAQWLNFNQHSLSGGHYETVYFPRCVYGDFLASLAADVLAAAVNDMLSLHYIQAEVRYLEISDRSTNEHILFLTEEGKNDEEVRCDYLVYAGGDLLPRPLMQSIKNHPMVLENLYGQPRHYFHQQLVSALPDGDSRPLQLVIAGGNACALDCFWGMANDPRLRAALQRGSLQIKQLAPAATLHSGAVLQPLPDDQQPDELRWISLSQQQLLQQLREEFLDPEQNFTAESYFLAVCTAVKNLEERASPHLFMLFLRQLGEVEQKIRDALPDIECFAIEYHARLEARLLFTPYEYWHTMRQLGEIPLAIERYNDKLITMHEQQGTFVLQLASGESLHCDALVNCTGARDPFLIDGMTLLDQLVASGHGVANGTGGFYLASDGRLKLADGTFSETVYLMTQRSIGLHQIGVSDMPRFTSANRLTAVRIAEVANNIASALVARLSEQCPAQKTLTRSN